VWAGDAELENFLEEISDTLWSPRGIKNGVYADHMQRLIRDSDLRLLTCMATLLRSCDNGLLLPEVAKCRQINCYRALWVIASLQTTRNIPTTGMYVTYLLSTGP
jgi:hypothetical protein